MKISEVMKEGELVPNVHCHIDKGLMEMTSAFSTCDRIFTTPIPLMYTRHTARFLLIWLLTVPMSLYHEFRKTQTLAVPFIIPLISFFNAIFLFGIEELGVQIEEPFSILPLANICNDIQYAGEDMLAEKGVSWFDSTEKLIEKNSNEKQIEKDKKFEVDRDVVKQLGPSAKDVFVYSKKGDNSINDKVAVSSLLNSRNSNSNNNINNSIPGFDPPSEGDVELAKVRKELEDAVSRNISSSSKRDLFIESRNKEDRKVEKVKRDTEKVKNDTVMDATVGDGDRSMNSEVFPSLK